jgi:hypothetical protein
MLPARPPFQFSLRSLFYGTLALSVQFGLATLPWPMNACVAPLYAAVLIGYALAHRPWLAALLGGACCTGATYFMMTVESHRQVAFPPGNLRITPWIGMGCCFPAGAYVALAVGLATREHRNRRRFQAQLESLYRELDERRQPLGD